MIRIAADVCGLSLRESDASGFFFCVFHQHDCTAADHANQPGLRVCSPGLRLICCKCQERENRRQISDPTQGILPDLAVRALSVWRKLSCFHDSDEGTLFGIVPDSWPNASDPAKRKDWWMDPAGHKAGRSTAICFDRDGDGKDELNYPPITSIRKLFLCDSFKKIFPEILSGMKQQHIRACKLVCFISFLKQCKRTY